METYLEAALRDQEQAREVIGRTGLVEIWRSVGAEPRLVGSLATGLLVRHRDIDFHIYSSPLRVEDSFAAMGKLAAVPGIRRIEYVNLLDTGEACLEWHAWYEADDGEPWQIDMIHLVKGSKYDGYFERVAERISAVLTPETRSAILRLKYEAPAGEKIMGVEYYRAVLEGGVRDWDGFARWRADHPVTGVLEWMP